MVPKSAEWWQGIWNINFFCQSLKITSDILRCIRYSALQCHLAAAFYFKINVASFIFSDLSSDAWTFSCLYSKRYIIYGQNSQSQEFQQNNLLKSCIGSLVKPENCNRTASPSDLAHCGGWIGGGGWIRRGTIKVASEELLLLVDALLGKSSTRLALGRPEHSSTSFKNVLNLRLS